MSEGDNMLEIGEYTGKLGAKEICILNLRLLPIYLFVYTIKIIYELGNEEKSWSDIC